MADQPDAELAAAGLVPGGFAGFPERAFVVSLRHGWAWLNANPFAWRRILRDLDPGEIDRTIAYFAAKAPKIRVGYPTAQAAVPQVTVVVEDESTQAGFLGDLADEEVWDDEAEDFVRRGEFRGQKLSVSITTDHPDVCLYLYRATGSILTAHKDWMVREPPHGAGLQMVEWVSGGAVIPDPRNPERLWGRQHRWNVAGLDGAAIPVPAPPSGVSVYLDSVVVDGSPGRVAPT